MSQPGAGMQLDSTLVGRPLRPLGHTVTWRETTNYAAAVGDLNPCYLDDSRPGGIVAPPLFAVALTWPLFAGIAEQLEGGLPAELVPTMVHAAEHLVLHRPVRPGDELMMTGHVAAVLPARAGTRLVLRVDAHAAGEAVFTEHTSALFRGVACADAGRGEHDVPALPRVAESGAPRWQTSLPIGRELPFVYDGCSNIVFPIHTSVSFARSVGLPDILLQGTAALALAARELVDREAGGEPARLKAIGCRFTRMITPGHPIRLQLLERQGDTAHFCAVNHAGEVALQGGVATLGEAV